MNVNNMTNLKDSANIDDHWRGVYGRNNFYFETMIRVGWILPRGCRIR